MCIPKWLEHDKCNSQILLSDNDQQVITVSCAQGAKSAICDYLV